MLLNKQVGVYLHYSQKALAMEVVMWGPMRSTTPVCPLILYYGLRMYEINHKEFIIINDIFLTH